MTKMGEICIHDIILANVAVVMFNIYKNGNETYEALNWYMCSLIYLQFISTGLTDSILTTPT